jgi:hypothetical protein
MLPKAGTAAQHDRALQIVEDAIAHKILPYAANKPAEYGMIAALRPDLSSGERGCEPHLRDQEEMIELQDEMEARGGPLFGLFRSFVEECPFQLELEVGT